MELNLSELDTMNPYQSFDYNSYQEENGENYWEKSKVKESQNKKKKVSFNDILSNMNLVVNKQGVLQFMAPNQNSSEQNSYEQNPNYNSYQDFSQVSQNQSQRNNQYFQQQQKKSEALEPSVKHSYIYNKYFKDYVDPNAEKPGPRVPKTKEEYFRMLLEDRKRAIEHKKRIEQIKSKKLLFTTTPGMGTNPRNIQPTKNNLRRMNFG